MYTHNKSTTTIKIEMLVVCQEAGLVCCKHGSNKISSKSRFDIRGKEQAHSNQQHSDDTKRDQKTHTQQKSINLLQDDEHKKKTKTVEKQSSNH